MIFLDNEGVEIDRIIGYLPPDSFLNELKRIHAGKGTFLDLKNRLKNDSTNFSILFGLSQKYENMGDQNSAHDYIRMIIDRNVDSSGTAYFYDLLYDARLSNDPEELIGYADNISDNSRQLQAYWEGMKLLRKNKNESEREADIFIKYLHLIETPSAGILNRFAWRMTQLGIHLDIALNKIDVALNMNNEPEQLYMYLDTKAEILWKLNRTQDALIEIEKCIKGAPENKYYQEQKEKFISSEA